MLFSPGIFPPRPLIEDQLFASSSRRGHVEISTQATRQTRGMNTAAGMSQLHRRQSNRVNCIVFVCLRHHEDVCTKRDSIADKRYTGAATT